MAIDYKKEWEKLHNSHGGMNIRVAGTLTRLSTIMNIQIQDTIDGREKLMQKYMKENILTEIDGADKHFHHVKIANARKARGPIGTMYIHKKDFAEWCEKKGDK